MHWESRRTLQSMRRMVRAAKSAVAGCWGRGGEGRGNGFLEKQERKGEAGPVFVSLFFSFDSWH